MYHPALSFIVFLFWFTVPLNLKSHFPLLYIWRYLVAGQKRLVIEAELTQQREREKKKKRAAHRATKLQPQFQYLNTINIEKRKASLIHVPLFVIFLLCTSYICIYGMDMFDRLSYYKCVKHVTKY